MKGNKKIIYIIIGIVAITLLLPQVSAGSMGFGPIEIIGSNKRDSLVIGTASLINDYQVAKYAVFRLTIPYSNENNWQPVPTEQRYIRVICGDCGAEMERYEAIENYNYPESMLVGGCENCGSTNLIFYELMPRDEFYSLSLEGAGKFGLKGKGNFVYVTTEKIPPGETCNINVLYDASDSYVKENEGKYWEARLIATLKEEVEQVGFGVVAGIGIRMLIEFKFPLFIDVPEIIEKGKEFTVHVAYGDLKEETWQAIPKDVRVLFNGETKWIDENGYVTFMAPVTRNNYSYEIKAEGSKYLSDVKIVTTGIVEESDVGIVESPPMMVEVVITGLVVLLCLSLIYAFKKKSSRTPILNLFTNRKKSKQVDVETKHVRRKPLFSAGDVATANIGQTERQEPTASFLGNVRDYIASAMHSDQEFLSTPKDIEDEVADDIRQSEVKTEFSDIESEIDHLLKSRKK